MSFPRQYRHTLTGRASAAGDEARTRVLEVALDLFAASGYRGTSVAQVAQHAGLSQAGLLHHFPSKVALLTAALEYREETEGTRLEVDGVAPLGWAAFDALTGLVARNAARPSIVRLFVTLSAEALDPAHPAHDWILNHYDSLTAWLTAAVEFGRAQGEFRPDTPVDTLVRLTIATMDGLQQQWLATGEGFDMAEEFRRYVESQQRTWKA
ncbi:TetR/AcrR family transcriptional regulator [Amycolatopsis sp. NPDC051758]|uniref:TetR/AcrR family transcriptional regulator n=1 Tax=Amycolatopsis sp. NPDC051758 TaxID=3363935 RepID=UPI0037A3C0B7